MHNGPHSWVAAPAAPGAAAPTPPTSVSVATAVSTFLLIDSTWVDDEVMTDLLSEDLTGCGRYGTKPVRLVCPSRPCGPWSLPGVVVASPPGAGHDGHVTRVVEHVRGRGRLVRRGPQVDAAIIAMSISLRTMKITGWANRRAQPRRHGVRLDDGHRASPLRSA